MRIRFTRSPRNAWKYAEWQAAAPYVIAGGSALASSAGSKKSAKGAKPDIPNIFKGGVGSALGLIMSRLRTGFPAYGGLATAGLDPLGKTGIGGYTSALDSLTKLSQGGINPDTLATLEKTTRPLADIQRGDLTAGVREAEAQGGRFFGSGAVSAESDALNRFEATRRSDLTQTALGAGGLQISAFDSIQKLLAAQYQEFLRQQPESAISLLASLMGGTPFSVNPQGSNLLQALGGTGNSLLGSTGFWDMITKSKTSPPKP